MTYPYILIIVAKMFSKVFVRDHQRLCTITQNHIGMLDLMRKQKNNIIQLLKTVADELNKEKNLDEIKRVPSSFPNSVSHIGEYIKGFKEYTDDVTKTTHDDVIDDDSNKVTTSTESNESGFGYVFYTKQYDLGAWHDSYKYLLHVASSRIVVNIYVLQSVVQELELKLFQDECNEMFQNLLL